jgi:tRNA threonylcarbamoyladenosine biosynthesis protein TsaE
VLNLKDLTNQMHIATNSSKFDISKEIDTAKIAKKVSKLIKVGDVLFFYGDIGVGKTTFIKYLINNLQKINRSKLTEVTSPTFSIVNEYKLGNTKILHYDLYRIKDKKELKNIGLLESYKDALLLIEWPELISKKPKNLIKFFFSYEMNFKKRYMVIKNINKYKT